MVGCPVKDQAVAGAGTDTVHGGVQGMVAVIGREGPFPRTGQGAVGDLGPAGGGAVLVRIIDIKDRQRQVVHQVEILGGAERHVIVQPVGHRVAGRDVRCAPDPGLAVDRIDILVHGTGDDLQGVARGVALGLAGKGAVGIDFAGDGGGAGEDVALVEVIVRAAVAAGVVLVMVDPGDISAVGDAAVGRSILVAVGQVSAEDAAAGRIHGGKDLLQVVMDLEIVVRIRGDPHHVTGRGGAGQVQVVEGSTLPDVDGGQVVGAVVLHGEPVGHQVVDAKTVVSIGWIMVAEGEEVRDLEVEGKGHRVARAVPRGSRVGAQDMVLLDGQGLGMRDVIDVRGTREVAVPVDLGIDDTGDRAGIIAVNGRPGIGQLAVVDDVDIITGLRINDRLTGRGLLGNVEVVTDGHIRGTAGAGDAVVQADLQVGAILDRLVGKGVAATVGDRDVAEKDDVVGQVLGECQVVHALAVGDVDPDHVGAGIVGTGGDLLVVAFKDLAGVIGPVAGIVVRGMLLLAVAMHAADLDVGVVGDHLRGKGERGCGDIAQGRVSGRVVQGVVAVHGAGGHLDGQVVARTNVGVFTHVGGHGHLGRGLVGLKGAEGHAQADELVAGPEGVAVDAGDLQGIAVAVRCPGMVHGLTVTGDVDYLGLDLDAQVGGILEGNAVNRGVGPILTTVEQDVDIGAVHRAGGCVVKGDGEVEVLADHRVYGLPRRYGCVRGQGRGCLVIVHGVLPLVLKTAGRAACHSVRVGTGGPGRATALICSRLFPGIVAGIRYTGFVRGVIVGRGCIGIGAVSSKGRHGLRELVVLCHQVGVCLVGEIRGHGIRWAYVIGQVGPGGVQGAGNGIGIEKDPVFELFEEESSLSLLLHFLAPAGLPIVGFWQQEWEAFWTENYF